MWRYLAASVRGTSHVEQDIPCQDSSLATLIGDTLLVVASDGAGSAQYSDQGSRIACDTIADEVNDYLRNGGTARSLTEGVADLWIDSVVRALHERAASIHQPVREFACTLLVCMLGPDGSFYMQLGDGGIIARYLDDYVSITWPSGGEYANTTFFLSDDRALEHCQFVFGAPAADEVAVFTDGLQMLALQFAAVKPHAPFFRPMFDRVHRANAEDTPLLARALVAYLESAAINHRTDDDKTLILAVRTGSASEDSTVATQSEAVTADHSADDL